MAPARLMLSQASRLGIDPGAETLKAKGPAKNSKCTTLNAGQSAQARGQARRLVQAQPSSSSRGSLIPKWWATSWMIVLRTWATTSASVVHTLQIVSW
jgi:hypothetical protein